MNVLTPLLNVEDALRSIDFYKHLGFAVDQKAESGGRVVWAGLSWGSIALMINASQERATRGARDSAQSYDDVVFYFSVENAQEIHERLLCKGYNPGPVEPQDYGVNEFTVRDPDGYELAFGSPIRQ